MSKKIIAPIAAGVLLAMAGAAQAATKTTTFQVSANVTENCVINAGNLAFSDFDGTNDITNAASTITVNCTLNTVFDVELNAGVNGTFTDRKLKLTNPVGLDTLNYNLYTDAARTNVWDDTNTKGGTGAGMTTDVVLDVYGKLLASNNTGAVEAGLYTDTITATIIY